MAVKLSPQDVRRKCDAIAKSARGIPALYADVHEAAYAGAGGAGGDVKVRVMDADPTQAAALDEGKDDLRGDLTWCGRQLHFVQLALDDVHKTLARAIEHESVAQQSMVPGSRSWTETGAAAAERSAWQRRRRRSTKGG